MLQWHSSTMLITEIELEIHRQKDLLQKMTDERNGLIEEVQFLKLDTAERKAHLKHLSAWKQHLEKLLEEK